VNRRVVLAAAFVLAMLIAAYFFTRAHPASASAARMEASAAEPVSRATPQPRSAPSREASPEPVAGGVASAPVRAPASSSAPASPAPTPQAASAIPDLDPREALGSKNAPVVMEVFSDFQCPACKGLFVGTNRQLMDNYVSTGKVYLIHRDFPLPMHAHSRVAAQYSRAAAMIGKLEAVEDTLFQNQEKWEQTGDVDGTVAAVLSPADMTKVRALVKGGTVDVAIEKDRALGQTYHVNQTPTTIFHANGQTFPYAGVMSWDILHQFLDQLLGQK
jgi:protein-disulfide isomerase